MSSRARTPSIESVSEISLHPDDDMYNNLDFRDAGVLNRSPSAIQISPTRSRQHGLFSRSVSANSHRGAYGDFEVRSVNIGLVVIGPLWGVLLPWNSVASFKSL
jgi:hypothetical protein